MKAAGFCLLISAVCAASPAAGGSLAPRAVPIDQSALFRIVGNFYNVDPDLLAAIAAIESGGDSRALSPAGAEGLMQLMPETAQRFRVTDPFDPVDNALGAARFIDYLRRRPDFRMSLPELLAAYNAGEGAVAKYDGVPPYAETREYVRRVIAAYLLEALIPRKAPSTSYRRPVASTLCTSGGPLTAVTAAAGQRAVAPGGRQVRPSGDRQPRDVFAQLAEIRRERALHLRGQAYLGNRADKDPRYTDSLPRGKTSSIFSLGDFSRYPDQASGREPEEAQCRDRREAMGLGRKN